MTEEKWLVRFKISRQKGTEKRYFQTFELEVDPDEYVLDGVERLWAFQDRSIVFRHACHHSTCGACAMLVNGVEKLTCITSIRSVTHNGGMLTIEPLRNFPIISDLAVDMSSFYKSMENVKARQVLPLKDSFLPFEQEELEASIAGSDVERLADCIECGMCVSACPSSLTSETYLGPAVFAAVQQNLAIDHALCVLGQVDQQNGVWRCHSAYECTAVCPSNVNPSWRIMDLRKKIIRHRIRSLFKVEEK